ncbi:MAG: hypothetical protein HY930_04670 [Euryarchaeota archaeon]|nr:hypothetical protein [Euryarchaeota archaeon]
MPEEIDKAKLEERLRDNLVSACCDYAIEFGEEKAKKLFEQAMKCMREGLK